MKNRKVEKRHIILCSCLLVALIMFGYRFCGGRVTNKDSLSEFQECYDSATIYYTEDFWEERFMAWETKPYLDEKLYDAILIMRDKSPLDSLALIIQQTTNKKQIERDHTDSFIVIVACSIGGKDTLSLSNNPGYVEINNRWYPDSSLFWWAVNTIAEKDESWMLNNNSFLNVISMPNDD